MYCNCRNPNPRTTSNHVLRQVTCGTCGREIRSAKKSPDKYRWFIKQKDGSYWLTNLYYTEESLLKDFVKRCMISDE